MSKLTDREYRAREEAAKQRVFHYASCVTSLPGMTCVMVSVFMALDQGTPGALWNPPAIIWFAVGVLLIFGGVVLAVRYSRK